MYNQTVTKAMVVLMLILASFTTNAQTPNLILGKWKDAEHAEKQIEITRLNGKFIGRSINSLKSGDNEKIILKDLILNEASKSYEGILINPKTGDEAKIEIKMIGKDKFKFSAGKFIFSKTFTFNRIAQ